MAVNVESVQRMVEQPVKAIEKMPSSVYAGAMAGSILASLLLFLSGRRQWGLFVGLWAPTILNMGQFYKQFRPSQDIANANPQIGG